MSSCPEVGGSKSIVTTWWTCSQRKVQILRSVKQRRLVPPNNISADFLMHQGLAAGACLRDLLCFAPRAATGLSRICGRHGVFP
jgi:hypothetical protein